MSYDELVSEVMDRLNLTSDEARERVGKGVNKRYKMVTSGIGLQTSRRVVVPMTIDPSDTDSILPDLIVPGMEKVNKVFRLVGVSMRILDEGSYDEVAGLTTTRRLPYSWAVKKMGAGQVVVTFDAYPEVPFTLSFEGYDVADVMADDAEPYLPTDFHDILVEGAMLDELRKMEKPELAMLAKQEYDQRLGELRLFIAKSSYKDQYQGKNKDGQWLNQWFARLR